MFLRINEVEEEKKLLPILKQAVFSVSFSSFDLELKIVAGEMKQSLGRDIVALFPRHFLRPQRPKVPLSPFSRSCCR